ncbi:MAG: hypothetical protein KBT34_10265 [Prevotella sp.]|nr:hypothetical protein [Candidatus Prevotella equi]
MYTTDDLKLQLFDLAEAINKKLFDGCREWHWVGDMIGGVCCFDDTDFINVEDMILIVDKDVDYDTYAEWRNAESDHPHQHINLRSWLMGARHEMRKVTKEDFFDELHDINKRVSRLADIFKSDILVWQ